MAFSAGNTGQQSEINVTPLIDVLLVLLIIFMIIVPQKPSALTTAVPQPPHNPLHTEPPPATIVLQVHSVAGSLSYSINQQPIAKEAIVARLREIFAIRQDKTMFIKGDPELEFGAMAEVISMGRQAFVDNIAVMTPKMEAGR